MTEMSPSRLPTSLWHEFATRMSPSSPEYLCNVLEGKLALYYDQNELSAREAMANRGLKDSLVLLFRLLATIPASEKARVLSETHPQLDLTHPERVSSEDAALAVLDIVPALGHPPGSSEDVRLQKEGAEAAMLATLRERKDVLRQLLAACSDHWAYEDLVYRFYHGSFKVYWIQDLTKAIVAALRDLAPLGLNPWFLAIVERGTGREFVLDGNARWTEVTRPLLEAFFHARYFLEMALKYADIEEGPGSLPSGYAALLCLYNLR
jgi:hypothetical protein